MTSPAASAIVTGAGQAVPPEMPQAALWEEHFASHATGDPSGIAAKIWASSGITTRHGVADPRREDVSAWTTGARMRRFAVDAPPLGAEAVTAALKSSGVTASEIGLFTVVSCTGYSTPGLDIRLAEELGMSAAVQRLHIGHMGCYAALPGLGAVSDYVVARQRPAVLLCLELTSLHVQPPTNDLQQVVAHALFSDAAAAVVVEPGTREWDASGWEVIDTVARTDHATSALMTWDVTDLGFKMGLSPEVPAVLSRHARPVVEELLAAHGLDVTDVPAWAIHPGGRKIVDVVGECLELSTEQLAPSYEVLRDYGNCSSATVLLVLDRVSAAPGEHCVAMAFGPGLTLYATLLRRR